MTVPTLQRLAVACLIRFRDALGDIGYAPVELLQDVLAACSPQQLAAIEDETLEGSGRTLKPWTWNMWREHWQKQFAGSFGTPAPGALPPLPPAAEVAEGEPGVPPADYRALYERCQAELEQKRAESGARLRALREQAEQERQARHTQVVDARTVPGRRRRPQQRPGPASSGGGGSSASHRAHVQQPAGSSKQRLLKKLGLGGSGSASRHAAAPPRRTVTVIRPAHAPTAAGAQHARPIAPQQARPSPSVQWQPLPHGVLRSPAGSLHSPTGSLASAGSSPLPWQQHLQAARAGSAPMRLQLQAAASSAPARQQLQVAGSSPLGQQRPHQQTQQPQKQQQQQQQQQTGPALRTAEAGLKPQLPMAGTVKSHIGELCSNSDVLLSELAGSERPQKQALPLHSPQQQSGSHVAAAAAAAAAQRKKARPAKPQVLEEVDLFAGVEDAPAQLRPAPQRLPLPQLKRSAEHSGAARKGGGGRGAQPPAKKPRQQQPAAQLMEVDLFDGL